MTPRTPELRDPSHWLLRFTSDQWMSAALGELRRAEEAYARADARAGVAGCKRAAGMALNAVLVDAPNEAWGRTYVEHVEALAREADGVPDAVRAACRVLLEARPPTADLLALRSRTGDARVVEAARDVMAHAYAAVVRAKAERA